MSWGVVLVAASLAVARLELIQVTPRRRRKPGHREFDHAIVAPLKERVSEAAGQPHGALHHLDRPGHLGCGRRAHQRVATLRCASPSRSPPMMASMASGGSHRVRLDAEAHPVGKGRGDHAVQAPEPAVRPSPSRRNSPSQGHHFSYSSTRVMVIHSSCGVRVEPRISRRYSIIGRRGMDKHLKERAAVDLCIVGPTTA